MKRILAFTLAVLLLLTMAACQKEEPVAPTTAPTTVPTPTTEPTPTEPAPPPEPEWEPGISRATYGEAFYTTLEKGAEVEVIGQYKDYFIIAGEELDLIVEERFVRLDSEELFEAKDGYARKDTQVYESVYMREEPIATLKTNTLLKVLEGKGDWLYTGNWLYVEWEGGAGYVRAEQVSDHRLTGGGGGNTGGSAPTDGTDVDIGSLSANGGGEIVLLGDYYGPEMEEDFVGGKGIVIAEDVEAYICLLLRDSEAKVIAYDEEVCTIYLENGLTGQLPRWLLKLEGDEEYEAWNGFIKGKQVVCEEYQMRNILVELNTNHEIVVLDELPDCYVIEVDGQIGYVPLDGVSATRITGGGGGGGGGNGGGGTGDGWTPPAM